MKAVIFALGAITPSIVAGQQKGWGGWSSAPAPAPPPQTHNAGWGDWKTTIQYVPTTVYNTVTNYVTVAGPTVKETIKETVKETCTVTDYRTVTQLATVVQSAAPVTVVQTQLQTQVQTIANTVTVTETVQRTATNAVTVQQMATVTNLITITSIGATTKTVSVSFTGIVTCPSRIVNPTYTPKAPLPKNYLWGCPPGKLCHPKKDNCNFEQNPPADTYVCAPEECLPVAALPPIDVFLNNATVNDNCAFITPIDDYFNLNPTFFGLDFDIFNIYGQPKCSTQRPASTVTVKIPAQPVTVPTTVTVKATNSGWQGWQAISSPTPASSSSWGKWSAAPQVTKRAELSERNLEKKAIVVASECYAVCDYAAAVYQSMGNVPALCSADSEWNVALARVEACTEQYSATGVTSVASILNNPIQYCVSGATKRGLFGRLAL